MPQRGIPVAEEKFITAQQISCIRNYMYIHLLRYEGIADTKTPLHVRQFPPDVAGLDPTL